MDEFDFVVSGDFGSFFSGDLFLFVCIFDMVGFFCECVYVYGGGVGGVSSKFGSEYGFSVFGYSIKFIYMLDFFLVKIMWVEFFL